ncbi:MAG TPA: hypothetical protein VGL35_08310 [Rhizomicrobium sp.]|jgi:tetratricopeptide (TPR) repeat protein
MGDEPEGLRVSGGGGSLDPAAMSLAMGAAAQNERVASCAEAFLETQRELAGEQKALVRLQAHELRHELGLRHWSLRVHHISDVMKLAFEFSVAVILLAVVAFVGSAIWSAAHDHGLVIEAFSVPPDLAARGLSGEVVAGRMLDRLSAMQAQTDTLRASNSYTNNWGDDIKVQIPDTGISIGEFNRYLHQWLGHQTHIGGDVVRVGSRLMVTARAGADAGQGFSGADRDVDRLLQQAAEAVYARTQPYRYGIFLLEHDKLAQANAVFAPLTQSGPPSERAWAYVGLGNVQSAENLIPEAEKNAYAGVALEPGFALGLYRLEGFAATLGHEQAALEAGQGTLRLLSDTAQNDIDPAKASSLRPPVAWQVDDLLGDYADEAKQTITLRGLENVLRVVLENSIYTQAGAAAEAHDLRAARLLLAEAPALTEASTNGKNGAIIGNETEQNVGEVELLGALAQKNWRAALRIARRMDAVEANLDSASVANLYRPTQIWPLLALAEAKTGNFAPARALIERTPLDCGPCLRARGMIRAAERNWSASAFWFAVAAKQGPSIPFAWFGWGEMLMAKGDDDGAIAKFALAHQKGPHFADPLEMWGEALTRKNRSDLALAKFEEAARYAPNWGRLHLKWGEALHWAGDRDGAQKQFAIAVHLDIAPSERSQLGRMEAGNG